MEEELGMDFEDEIESRKKLDERRIKLQKELRDVEKLSCVERVSGQPKNDLQHQLQDVERRRHDLMPVHQRVLKKVTKDTKHPG